MPITRERMLVTRRKAKPFMRRPLSILQSCILFWISTCLFSAAGAAQSIIVQVLNGKTGKGIGNAKVQISLGDDAHRQTLELTTNAQGEIQFEANRSSTFQVHQVGFATCGEQPIGSQARDYPVDKILKTGLVTANECGRLIQEPRRGRLVFFVRHASWGERLKQ